MSEPHSNTFTFFRHPHTDVRYVVKSKVAVAHEAASFAFRHYVLNHLEMPPGPAELEIDFDEWFPATEYRAPQPKIYPGDK